MSESTQSKSSSARSKTRSQDERPSGTSSERFSGSNGETASGGGDLTAQGQEVIGQAQAQAQNLVNTAREQATTQLTTQKARAADSLTTIATALQVAGRELREQNGGPIADYIDTAAIQVDQFANALRDQDIYELLKTTEQFARRQPALFVAATFALGFAGTRFLKSSSPSSGSMSQGNGYWQSQSRSDWQSGGSYGAGSSYGSGSSYGTSGSYGDGGAYGSSYGGGGSYGSSSASSTGSRRSDFGATTGGSESTSTSSDEARFTGSVGSKSNSEWQSGTGLNSGPEGQ